MLVATLHLIPVGQLDGWHVSRAVLGNAADRTSRYIPLCLMAIGLYGTFVLHWYGEYLDSPRPDHLVHELGRPPQADGRHSDGRYTQLSPGTLSP